MLTLLLGKRPDCAFVVSTHDVILPLDNPSARTLLIRGCTCNGRSVTAWDVDLIPSAARINEELKKDILGARRKILFIEGTDKSLDKPLYSLIFPGVSILAKGNCRYVEHAVTSIRDAGDLHWLDAFGLVDNVRRPQGDVERLKEKGVYATAVFSVESIYYHPKIQQRVAARHANATGDDVEKYMAEATSAAVNAIAPHAQRLSERVAEKLVREEFFAHIPNKEHISAAAPVIVSIDVHKIVGEERARLQDALDASNLTTLVSRYPVRETPALNGIAQKLGFQSRNQYESAVRKLLIDEVDALTFVRSLFGTLAADIGASAAEGGASMPDTTPAIVA